jgi:hypothetical protein
VTATADPLGFVADLPEHVILDEVQRGDKPLSTAAFTSDLIRT